MYSSQESEPGYGNRGNWGWMGGDIRITAPAACWWYARHASTLCMHAHISRWWQSGPWHRGSVIHGRKCSPEWGLWCQLRIGRDPPRPRCACCTSPLQRGTYGTARWPGLAAHISQSPQETKTSVARPRTDRGWFRPSPSMSASDRLRPPPPPPPPSCLYLCLCPYLCPGPRSPAVPDHRGWD